MSRFSSSACSKTILPLLGLLFAIPFSEPLKGQEVSPFQPRIVGGQVAEQDEFPWIVSLQGPWSCGASLIGPEWILTAAHCVVDDDGNVLPAEDIQLAVGQLYLSEVSTYYAAEQVIVHPGYDSWTMENDIALIRLAQGLPESAPTLSLNDDSQVPVPGTDAVVAGWGTLSSGGGSPDRLHKVTVPIVSLEKANDPKAYGGSILPNMLAAGFTEGGKDSCQGDSGGPLVIDINGQMIQVGVVSWGKGCADPYAYGIYTRVSSYTDWIEGLTGLSGGGSPPPVELSILKSPSSKTALPGENVTFSVQAQGEPPLTFQWFFNGQSIAGAQSASLSLPDVGTEDAGDYAVQVTSGEQQVMSEVATLTLAQVISLEEALDQPQWVFNQGADSKQWFGQSIATHDQTDAAQSPLLDHLESASFSTQLDGPGILRFFWKVSSEADYDFLECWVDDVLMHSLSGEVDWQEAKVTLTEGSHEVRWVYRKDEWLSVGQDTAWVDQIHFEALSKLVLLKAPESVVATEGESVTFSVEASGQPPLAYQWYWNQTPIAGAQSPSYTIASVASDDQGDYQVEITSGADTLLSPVATLSLWQTTQLNEALDQASLVFSTDEGDQPWSGQTTWTYDQVDAAQSGVIADGQSSILSSVLQGPGILTFYWKVSSEMEYDHLECWVDGTLEGQISGEVDWHEFKIALPDGDHTIQWVYRKDETVSEGEDAGWVDQIQFQVGMALTILQSPASIEVFPGQSASFSVEAHGEAPLLYQWTFNGQPISGAELPTLEIETVSASDAGVYAVEVSSGSEQVTSATAHLVLIETIPLAEAVDQPDMNFESPQGQPTWSGQSSISHDQVDAAQSPPLDDDAFASFATQLQGPGKLEFYWKVSSEDGWDMLECHVDDQLQRQISGEVDWTPVEIFLSEGMHTVNWVYRKDAYLSEGLDAAWVDQIKYTLGTSGPSVVYSEVFDQASKASAWMVTSLEDPFSSDYEQTSADHYWVASADQSSGIQWELSGNQFFLTPSETHPFLHVMTGDYPQKGYHSLAWKFNVSGAISSLDWITLSLYREEGDDLQAAYLDVQPSIDAQGAYSFSAHLGDSNWKLLYEDHMWDLDDVFQGVSSLSLEMTSLIEGQDPAVVQIQAFEIM
ncbi:MAG: trypsin-like serine protease, partial [Verrucomicrobiota bacterium]|nr:trypsin-like serine protease [Verrucomicrobiota bacterium]